ncbi:MAG TPA: CoA-binding protein [Bdellovibrionota bacterium]|nr:CoA-binding protein [Bdellovibrionota bacterium]
MTLKDLVSGWFGKRPSVAERSAKERFWDAQIYLVIGNSAKMPFPRLTYLGLKANKKTVFAIDPASGSIEGDRAFADLKSFSGISERPEKIDAAVLELPNDETARWVSLLADFGIKKIWIHQDTETPQALQIAKERGVQVFTGTCAVMYLNSSFPHSFHRCIMKMTRRY